MNKFQNYSHYKLPITINPLEYGKLIEQFGNKYIIQLNTNNILILEELESNNYLKFFRKGELMLTFKDSKISENTFSRTISDQKYTFKNNKLVKTEILSVNGYIEIFNEITPLFYTDSNSIQLKQDSIYRI